MPYKNCKAKFLAERNSGYFEIESLSRTPRSHIQFANILCDLRFETFNGSVYAAEVDTSWKTTFLTQLNFCFLW